MEKRIRKNTGLQRITIRFQPLLSIISCKKTRAFKAQANDPEHSVNEIASVMDAYGGPAPKKTCPKDQNTFPF